MEEADSQADRKDKTYKTYKVELVLFKQFLEHGIKAHSNSGAKDPNKPPLNLPLIPSTKLGASRGRNPNPPLLEKGEGLGSGFKTFESNG